MTRSGNSSSTTLLASILEHCAIFLSPSWILKLAMELFSPYILPEMHRQYALLWVTSNYTPSVGKTLGMELKVIQQNTSLAISYWQSSRLSHQLQAAQSQAIELSLKAFCSSLKYAVPLYLQTANQSTKKGQSWCLNAVSNFTFAYPVNYFSLSSQKTQHWSQKSVYSDESVLIVLS